jgi:hypothetical protein
MKHKSIFVVVILALCIAAAGTARAQANQPNGPERAGSTATALPNGYAGEQDSTNPVPAAASSKADDVYVALSTGYQFGGTGVKWSDYFCVGQEICKVGDVNGDGKADVIAFVRTNNGSNDSDVYVALSNGVGFSTPQKWADYFCTLEEICAVGDVDGDGKADIVTFVRTNNGPNDSDVYVALSDGTKFGSSQKWHEYFCTLQEICAVGDANGDGKADLITFVRTNNGPNDSDVYVALSDGTKFGSSQKWHEYFCTLQEICAVGDVNGDGKADLITFVRTNNGPNDSDVYVALSNGTAFGPSQKWHDYFCTLQEICAVGDVNGDAKADLITFVRTNNGPNDSDVYVALSNGTTFGPSQKWHDYFCTLEEICATGDFNGDGKVDVAAFVRDQNTITYRTIDVTVSLYRITASPALRAQYEAIFGAFADAIYEMTNGTHRVGTVTIYLDGALFFGGHSSTANVVWGSSVWPNSPVSGVTMPGEHVNMADIFTFKTPFDALASANATAAGYTLAHEFGHYYYGLYDEYQGPAPCDLFGSHITDPWLCDIPVPNSVMTDQWQAAQTNAYAWLNFSVAKNQTRMNANYRAYGASGWEVLTRSPLLDPRSSWLGVLPVRLSFPELGPVAPAAGEEPTIELPNPLARHSLQFVWVDPASRAQSTGAPTAGIYVPLVQSPTGTDILYPEAAQLVASLTRDGDFVAKAEVSALVMRPDASTFSLTFRDDGVSPDAEANDGLYSTIMPYTEPGLHHVDVRFTNDSGLAEFTYLHDHYTPGPNGESFDLQPSLVGENFNQSADVDLMVSGFEAGAMDQSSPTQMTVDNRNFPGRIDMAGDQDSFTFSAEQPGELVLRITDLAFGMQPHVRVFKGDPLALIGDYAFVPQGNAYFFTKLNAVAGDQFLVEIEHLDSAASDGFFNISVGQALPNTIETRAVQLYLPLVLR